MTKKSLLESDLNIQKSLQNFWRFYATNLSAKIGIIGLIVVLAAAIFAPLIAPQNPYDLAQLTIIDGRLPPGAYGESGRLFILGTDEQGRDILSAVLYGLRTSLLVGLISVAVSLFIGTLAGLLAGYFGGKTDAIIMRLVDLQLSIPTILIALVLLAVLGKGFDKIIIALVVAQWAMFARTARSSALVERGKDYVMAAKCLQLGTLRILFVHLLPNCLPPLIVLGTISVGSAIGLEATLSFLGLGVPLTEPSLGLLISNGFEYLLSGRYWISSYPGLALMVTIMSINLVGDQLRDLLNPRLKS